MATSNQPVTAKMDWSAVPSPTDDGGADHLAGMDWPDIALPATSGPEVNISSLAGLTIVFAYPMTGRPDVPLPDNWDLTPGARGCTPQSCSFRDAKAELEALGVDHLFGLSVQDSAYQREAADRLHLPYPLLSDEAGNLRTALNLPVMEVGGMTLLKRLSMAVRDGKIEKVWYPVFPPDANAELVVEWLRN